MNHDSVLFFDWGGVIADDPGDDFFLQLLMRMGVEGKQARIILKRHFGDLMEGRITDTEFWQIVAEDYNVAVPNNIPTLQSQWAGLMPNIHMIEFIHELKQQGYRLAVLSNVIASSYNVLSANGHYDYFDHVIASCHEGVAKPDVAIYKRALEIADVEAYNSIFIDDKQRNLDVAAKLGFRVVLAKNAQQTISDIKQIL